MYGELGLSQTDGEVILANSTYFDDSYSADCNQHPNGMWTTFFSNEIRVCQGIPNLRTIDQAMLMLHESLHTAGQLENPPISGAPSSPDISGFVRVKCNLH